MNSAKSTGSGNRLIPHWARRAGAATRWVRTHRAKNGTQRSLLVEAEGGPLAVVVAPANEVDAQLLDATIEAIVIERPKLTAKNPQPLCLDKAYDNPNR